MAVQGVSVTLSSGTAVAIAGSTGSVHGVVRVLLKNIGAGTAYLGGLDVTTAGYPLSTGDTPLPVTLYTGETLYGCSTGTPTVNALRVGDNT